MKASSLVQTAWWWSQRQLDGDPKHCEKFLKQLAYCFFCLLVHIFDHHHQVLLGNEYPLWGILILPTQQQHSFGLSSSSLSVLTLTKMLYIFQGFHNQCLCTNTTIIHNCSHPIRTASSWVRCRSSHTSPCIRGFWPWQRSLGGWPSSGSGLTNPGGQTLAVWGHTSWTLTP